MSNKNLTIKYAIHQAVYWAASCGIISYAATFLLDKGFSAAQTGTILFGANFLSFFLQPFLASFADKSDKNIIPAALTALTFASLFSFTLIRFVSLPPALFAALYVFGVMTLDMAIPLTNSLAVLCTSQGYNLNYGIGRGAGAFGYAVTSLGIGYAIKGFGINIVPIISISMLILVAVMNLSYPQLKSGRQLEIVSRRTEEGSQGKDGGLKEFFGKYKWYTMSLGGVLCLAVGHIMMENYMVEIIKPLGGDSSNLGLALFIATVIETVGMVFFVPVYKKLGSYRIFIIAAASFVLKAVLFFTAKSMTVIYMAQILQLTTYTLLSPVQLYYARECTDTSDMVKGQSVITASYALGCALGNLLGGALITSFGIKYLTGSAIIITALGLAAFTVTVPKALKKHT